jgi:hypothetical protein
MAAERLTIRDISWRDIFPWLIVFRTFGLASSLPVLFLATLGAVLMPLGWWVSEQCFVPSAAQQADREFVLVLEANRSGPHRPFPPLVPNDGRVPATVREVLSTQPDIVQPVFHRFIAPVASLFDVRLTLAQAGYYAVGTLWMLLVWGFYGGAITRIAVVKLGREEQISLGEALSHVRRKLLSYIFSPLFPLLGVFLIGLPVYLLGLLMRLEVGVLVAGLAWLFVLLGGLAMAILLFGALFGWPLMWGVISSEPHGDAFEAFSRSYSYTFGRPLHYLFYALLATLFGGLSWLLVYHMSELVIFVCRLPAAWGAGPDRWNEVLRMIDRPSADAAFTGSPLAIGGWLIGSFESVVRTIATAFGYSFFWCQAAAVYLLLRRDVDQTEFDEVFVEREDRRYELPELKPMAAISPGGATEEPSASSDGTVEQSAP